MGLQIFHSDEIFHWDWMKIMGQGLLLQAWPFGYSNYVGVSERWRKAAVQKREAWKLGALRNLHVMPDFMGF